MNEAVLGITFSSRPISNSCHRLTNLIGTLMNDTRLSSSAIRFAGAVAVFCLSTSGLFAASDTLDLKHAVVVFDKTVKGPPVQAVRVLIEEVQKRTQMAWNFACSWLRDSPFVFFVVLAPFVDSI